MSIVKEELLVRDEIYNGRIINVMVDTVLLDGKERVREVVLDRGVAAILPVTKKGDIVLVKQYRYATKEALWEIPAGKLEKGEDITVCAFRELKEETGCIGNLTPLGEFYTTPGFCNEKVHLFLAEDLQEGRQDLEEGEFLEMRAFSFEEIKKMMSVGDIRDAKTLAAIALAQSRLSIF